MSIEKELEGIALVTSAHVENARAAVARRDQAILKAHESGLGYGTIAKLTNLSRARVQKIVNAKRPPHPKV